LLAEIKRGISKATEKTQTEISGIGIDSWGVDFGLLNAEGHLIENPYHYRDSRTDGIMEKAFELMSEREIYENTGTQLMQINSVYQLLSMRLADSPVLAKTKSLLFTADLFSYYLCDEIYAEYSLASTSQLMDMNTGQWSKKVLDGLSLPMRILPDIVMPGTIVGQLKDAVKNEIGCDSIPVIAVGSHDTACAVAAIPADEKTNWAYLSSGTWSLMGVEIPEAIINDKTFKYGFTNEGGVENTIRLLKNIMGLWLVQECKRQWQKDGEDLSYSELTSMAEKAKPFAGFINPDDSKFLSPGNMPQKINDYLKDNSQNPINDKGQMVRMFLESLALKYRMVTEHIEEITARPIEVLHIVGGGTQNELLCQFTANSTGKKIITGPVEGTAIGNILMQAKATGQISTLAEAREILRKSVATRIYEPQDTSVWDTQYKKYLQCNK
jgi:sugar (pentulose or hexulose) kinase